MPRMLYAALLVLGLLLASCTAPLRGMRAVPAGQVDLRPPADQAAIVFLRQVRVATSTSLFELRGQPDRFIGLLVSDTRLLYLAAPGRTRFMVIGQSASFMDAELQAGKTYYVAVVQGDLAQEQFVFRPLRPGTMEMPDIRECLASCVWVENTDKSQAWARKESSSIQRKKARYLPRWESRTTRPTLLATDGQ
jgi:hypothetical protein